MRSAEPSESRSIGSACRLLETIGDSCVEPIFEIAFPRRETILPEWPRLRLVHCIF
jgi:hypothetical protein